MSKSFLAVLLLIIVSVITGCAFPEGYHRDDAQDYGNHSQGYGGGHSSHH